MILKQKVHQHYLSILNDKISMIRIKWTNIVWDDTFIEEYNSKITRDKLINPVI